MSRPCTDGHENTAEVREIVTAMRLAGPMFLSLLAIPLQIQINISVFDSEIRISLSDILLPIIIAWLIWQALALRATWPNWRVPRLPLAMFTLTIVMTYAALLGWVYMDHVSTWGLFNKYAGWYVLMAYFSTGVLVVLVYGVSVRATFVWTFVTFAWCMGIVQILDAVAILTNLAPLFAFKNTGYGLPLQGVMASSSAYAFLIVTAFCLQAAYVGQEAVVIPTWLYRIGLSVLSINLFYTGSRGAWIGLAVAAVFLVWQRRELAKVFVIVGLATTAVVFLTQIPIDIGGRPYPALGQYCPHCGEAREALSPASILAQSDIEHIRIDIARDGLALWADHPIFGAGLGHHLAVQTAKTKEPLIIHNTGLWLLVETGIVGAMAFSAFFVVCFAAIWRDRAQDPFFLATLATLVAFAAISITHELMYQRYFWLIAGMALVQMTTLESAKASAPLDKHVESYGA